MEVPGFSGAESADVPLAAPGFEGVERQAVEYWPRVDCSRHGATVAACRLGLFLDRVASLSCWLPDGGSGGVILELAAMVATSQFGWWFPDHTGDKAPLCPGSATWLGGSFLVYSLWSLLLQPSL